MPYMEHIVRKGESAGYQNFLPTFHNVLKCFFNAISPENKGLFAKR